jgi:hypothetical protein
VLIEPNSRPGSRSGELVVSGLSGLNPSARVIVKQSGR